MSIPKSEEFDAFPIGTRVHLRKNRANSKYCCCDFHWFDVGETGTVISNSYEYLGIRVRLDHTTIEGVGSTWGFNPEHLEVITGYGNNMVEVM